MKRVADGETLTAALASRVDFPKRKTFEKYLRRHPDLRARLEAARPTTGQQLIRDRWQCIMRAIRSGSSVKAAVASVGGTLPSFFKVTGADHGARAEFVAATAEREAGGNSLGKTATGRWTNEHFDRALSAMRERPTIAARSLLVGDIPGITLVLERARDEPDFRDKLIDVMRERARYRARLRLPPRTYPPGQLRRGLMLLDTYAAAMAAVKSFDPFTRDDAISEIVIAVLEDQISIDDVRTRGKRLAMKRVMGDWMRTRSLDDKLFGNPYGETVVDTISNDDQILFY